MSVVASTVTTLYERTSELLAVCEEALDLTAAGAPERVYIAPAEPAFDCCPFLTVHVSALTEAPTVTGPGGVSPGHRTRIGSIILSAFTILAVRCAPSVQGANGLPPLAEIEAVAREVEEDGWSLWNTLRHAIADGVIFGDCSEVFFDGGVPIPEQGGCVGWRFIIRAAISGIPNPEGS